MDKGVPKWHVTEGILKPAGREGALDVIPKGGNLPISETVQFLQTPCLTLQAENSKSFSRKSWKHKLQKCYGKP
jgi:hypothetical protein